MINKHYENLREILLKLPYFILLLFPIVHLGVYFQFDVSGKTVSLSFVNTIVSMLYLLLIYIWALWVSQNRKIQILALVMGTLSILCIVMSLRDFGPSINDALFTGSAVLSLAYVFTNAEKLILLVKRTEKYLTASIWSFVVVSIILFIFFQERYTRWGEGLFLFGHRYASVCSLVMILLSLKLMNKTKNVFVYWLILFTIYFVCFWTGARIYMLCNLGIFYSFLFTKTKSIKSFLFACIIVTLASVVVFSFSSASKKTETIIEKTSTAIAETDPELIVSETYVWVDSLSHGRLSMWENCVFSYAELPLVNKLIGSGNKYMYDHNWGLSSHTDFLNILHFHGCIGLMLFLLLFVAYPIYYWRSNELPLILLIGFLGVWFTMALLNGYASYTANMMSLPYICVMAHWKKEKGDPNGTERNV